MLKKLGKYEIIEELGKGAMGIVYKAYDPLMARYVALKTMSYSESADPEFKRRFYKEAQAPGRLHHENIVIIYELNEDQGVPFIAMEFLEGSDLQNLINASFIFTLKKIIDITIQVSDALYFAHQNGIIHRDVKPANIYLLRDGKVKIVDFGIAQISQSSLMTKTGMLMGTPSYMSPEQVKCEPLTGRSDQFSVGVILYELLTGRRPFDADTYTSILYKILHQDPIPVREIYPTCNPDLEAVVMKALNKNPDDRFTDLASLARRLRKVETEMEQDTALDSTIAITRADTGDQSLKIEIIHRYMREGKYELALRVIDKLRAAGESPEILEAIQEDIQEKKRLDRIEQLISEGTDFFEDEHFDLALECFNEALAIDANNSRVLEWVRKTHQKEAEKRLRQSIGSYLDKGKRAEEQRNFTEAIKLYGEALKLNPTAAEIADRLKTAQRLQDYQEKEAQCHSLCQQARTLLEQGKREEARTFCRKASQVLPDFTDIGAILQQLEQQEKEELVQKALQDMESHYLKKEFDQALTLAGDTVSKVGLDPRLQQYIRKIQLARRRKLLMVAAALVVLAVAASVALYFFSPQPAPVAVPGFLVVDVRPCAEILQVKEVGTGKAMPVDDGATPLRLPLPPGRYTVRYQNRTLQKNPAEETVTITSGQKTVINCTIPGFNPAEAVRSILDEGSGR